MKSFARSLNIRSVVYLVVHVYDVYTHKTNIPSTRVEVNIIKVYSSKKNIIPVGVMSTCWDRKKKLAAGASMLTIGEQLCRRANQPHRKNKCIDEREVSR